jgi:predicted Zn-dependent peptidase
MRILSTLLAILAPAAALAQDVQVEKYQLKNGLTVILHEDHALPIATINIWYRVGAIDEPPGRSGFAHLFEHLMFMGTRRVEGSMFDVLMENGGGANNASTDLHRTNYFSWGPAGLLPTLLWLDADRLEDLGASMTREKLDLQRDVVRNERRQTTENRPYGKAEEHLSRLLYPPTHPYHDGVIGTHEDLEAASVTDVKDFFATFYVPNNASLVVAGDFQSAEVKPLIERLFGTLPRGADVPRKTPQTPVLGKVVRTTMIDTVELPMVMMAYHSPAAYGEGDAEMQLAARVLGEGQACRLYKRLVYDDQIASSVSVAQDGYPFSSRFIIQVYAKPDADLARVEEAVDEEIARLVKEGPTTEELEARKAAIELATLTRLQSLREKADQMNEYEYYWGEPNAFRRDLDRFRHATPEGVKAWAARTLTANSRVIMRVLPEAPRRAPSARDTPPTAMNSGTFRPAAPEPFTLTNGIRVMLWTRRDLPMVAMRVLVKPPGAIDTPAKAGLSELTATMIEQGTGEWDALAFEREMKSLGAEFGASADQESAGASLTVLKRNFDRALALAAGAIKTPRLDATDWDRIKGTHLDDLRQADEEPNAVAAKVASRLLFGDANPYGKPVGGTVRTVEPLTIEDIKAHHAAVFRPEYATILIAGDLSREEAKTALDAALGDWKSPQTAPIAGSQGGFETPRAGDALRVAIVDRPGAVQTVIRFALPGVKYSDASRVPRTLLGTVLGGSFTSRLNQNLREKHGYTYGARCNFVMEPSAGSFVAYSSVKADVTGPALKEFLGEIARIRGGDISEVEAGKVRETVRHNTVSAFEGLQGLLGANGRLVECGLPLDTIATDLAAMQNVTAAELNALARPAIPLEQGVLVLVGDQGLILEQIKGMELPTPLMLDSNGDPVK